MSTPEPETYISRAACGCIKMMCVDAPDDKRRVARYIAQAIRRGETINRVPSADVRTQPDLWPSSCPQCNPARYARQAQKVMNL